jgi:hypothetical protein
VFGDTIVDLFSFVSAKGLTRRFETLQNAPHTSIRFGIERHTVVTDLVINSGPVLESWALAFGLVSLANRLGRIATVTRDKAALSLVIL